MLPYLALLMGTVALLTLSRLASTRYRGQWTYFDGVLILALVGFAGSRVGVGTDYDFYRGLWDALPTHSAQAAMTLSPQEDGFVLLEYVLKSQWSDGQALFWFSSAATVILALVAIKREAVSPTIAVVLYILLAAYLAPFNVVRQGLAASIIFFAATRWLGRRRLAYLAAAAVAFSIHTSSLVPALALWLLWRWRPKPMKATLTLAFATALGYALVQLPAIAAATGHLNTRYAGYVESGDAAGYGTVLMIAAKLCLLFYCLSAWKLVSDRDRTWTLFASLAVPALVLGTQVQAFARLDIYFTMFLPLAVAAAIKARANTVETLAVLTACAGYFTLFIQNYGGLLGYESTIAGWFA